MGAAVLQRLDRIGYLHQLAHSSVGIGEGIRFDEVIVETVYVSKTFAALACPTAAIDQQYLGGVGQMATDFP